MNRRFAIAAALTVALVSAAALEVGARLILARSPLVAKARRVLAGTEAPWERPRLVAHPTLGWIPNPAHPDHSPQGLRGRIVPLERTPGVRRIVALGPSTVYGYSVGTAKEAWPARLEALLGQSIEVVNGGVPAYTSREILLAWLEKFRLWRPDAVIVELGGNDAASYFRPGWTPDGAHYRRAWSGPRRLAGLSRFMAAHSAFFGAFQAAAERPWVLGMFLDGPPTDFAEWYPPTEAAPWRAVPSSDLPLVAHADALLHALVVDGVRVVVVPFALSPRDDLAAAMAAEYGGSVVDLRAAYARDRAEVLAAAARAGVPVAPGWEAKIDDARWTDGCHLDAEGERAKAAALLPYVLGALTAFTPL